MNLWRRVEASCPGPARRTSRVQGQGQGWEQETGRMLTHHRQGLGFFWVRNTDCAHTSVISPARQSLTEGLEDTESQKDEG